ncbi:hypothetical protein BH10ACI4_BH10ACI4_03950 [soil metagenome]
MLRHSLRTLAALVFTTTTLNAQTPPPPPTTHVLVMLTVKPGADQTQRMKLMPDEVRDTVRLYLNGKIENWYGRSDGKGVVFILNCKTTEEAQAIMESLPLDKAHLVDLQYTPLTPLTPLRFLVGPAQAAPTPAP